MRTIVLKMCIVLFFLMYNSTANAQLYSRGEQTTILPSQVMIENYTAIVLGKEISAIPGGNRFDKSNLYTYLQLIHDDGGRDYQVLFQVSFQGKILFLAYSNNLAGIFNKADKPMNVFVNCIKTVNDHLSQIQNTEAAIRCIIERLNYCSN